MEELEIKKQSFNIQEVADSVAVCDDQSLRSTLEIIKAIRKHKEIILNYWKDAKESAKKTYQDICNKEKDMLQVCETSEQLLKNKILNYKKLKDEKYKRLIEEAEINRQNQIKKIFEYAMTLENQGNQEQAQIKFKECEKLKKIKLSLDLYKKENNISTQKRWKCKVTDNKLVPCFFNSIEIREINTKKLLEIRKTTPTVQIPGVEFYTEENLIIRGV